MRSRVRTPPGPPLTLSGAIGYVMREARHRLHIFHHCSKNRRNWPRCSKIQQPGAGQFRINPEDCTVFRNHQNPKRIAIGAVPRPLDPTVMQPTQTRGTRDSTDYMVSVEFSAHAEQACERVGEERGSTSERVGRYRSSRRDNYAHQ
jgi:hypothetical protein